MLRRFIFQAAFMSIKLSFYLVWNGFRHDWKLLLSDHELPMVIVDEPVVIVKPSYILAILGPICTIS